MRQLSKREVRDFAQSVTDESVLHSAIQWIAAELSPEDVFSEDDMAEYARCWAMDNGWTDPREAYPNWDSMTDDQKDEAIKNSY